MKRSGPIKRKTPLRRTSKKRARELKAYSLLRAAFLLTHSDCQACPRINQIEVNGRRIVCVKVAPAGEIHHKAGRIGGRLLDTDTWLAVCRECHNFIHEFPSISRNLGLLK